jgi:hypothetical protein
VATRDVTCKADRVAIVSNAPWSARHQGVQGIMEFNGRGRGGWGLLFVFLPECRDASFTASAAFPTLQLHTTVARLSSMHHMSGHDAYRPVSGSSTRVRGKLLRSLRGLALGVCASFSNYKCRCDMDSEALRYMQRTLPPKAGNTSTNNNATPQPLITQPPIQQATISCAEKRNCKVQLTQSANRRRQRRRRSHRCRTAAAPY